MLLVTCVNILTSSEVEFQQNVNILEIKYCEGKLIITAIFNEKLMKTSCLIFPSKWIYITFHSIAGIKQFYKI